MFDVFQMPLLWRFCQNKDDSFPFSQQDIHSFIRIYKVFLKVHVSLSMLWPMSDTCHPVPLVWEYFYYIFQFLLPNSIFFVTNLRFFSSFINTLNKSQNRILWFSFYRGSSLLSDKFNYRIFWLGFRSKVRICKASPPVLKLPIPDTNIPILDEICETENTKYCMFCFSRCLQSWKAYHQQF